MRKRSVGFPVTITERKTYNKPRWEGNMGKGSLTTMLGNGGGGSIGESMSISIAFALIARESDGQ